MQKNTKTTTLPCTSTSHLHTDAVTSLLTVSCPNSSSSQLLSTSRDKTALLSQLSEDSHSNLLLVPARSYTKANGILSCSAAFIEDSHYLFLFGSWDGFTRLYHSTNSSYLHLFREHKGGVTSIDVSKDGRFLVSVGFDGMLNIYDVINRNLVYTIQPTNSKSVNETDNENININDSLGERRVSYVNCVKIIEANDKEICVACGGEDNKVKIYRFNVESLIESDREVKMKFVEIDAHKEAVQCMAVSKCGKFLATGGRDRTVYVFEVCFEGDNQEVKKRGSCAASDKVSGVSFHPYKSDVIAVSCGDKIEVFDMSVGEKAVGVGEYEYSEYAGKNMSKVMAMCTEFSREGNNVYGGYIDGTIRSFKWN